MPVTNNGPRDLSQIPDDQLFDDLGRNAPEDDEADGKDQGGRPGQGQNEAGVDEEIFRDDTLPTQDPPARPNAGGTANEPEIVYADEEPEDGGGQSQNDGQGRQPAGTDTGEEEIRNPKISARIAREQEARRQAEEREARAQMALRSEQLRSAAAEKTVYEIGLNGIKDRLKSVQSDLVQAKEAGDTAKEVELQTELSTLSARQIQYEKAANDANQTFEKLKAEVGTGGQPPAGGQVAQLTAEGQRFLSKHGSWWNDPNHRDAKIHTLMIDEQLAREGWDKNSPDYYREIEKRAAKRFPEIYQAQPGGNGRSRAAPTTARGAARGATAGPTPAGGRGASGQGSSNRITITAADRANMAAFGLDPMNKQHVVNYAREKQQMEKRRR